MRFRFLLFLLVIVGFCWTTQGHVLGVDFGSDFIKIAAPRSDQSVDIVLNELSRRKTENFFGFRNGELYIGSEAKNLAARFPLKTCSAVNQLMGLTVNSSEWKAFEKFLYEYNAEASDRGTAVIPLGEDYAPFSVEEIFALFLSYFRRTGVNDGVIDPKNVVITIPFHATISERRAILDAAKLAKVNVLGFMHSTTAAAFYWGIRRRGLGKKEATVVVFDIGATHTEAGVYLFSPAESNASFSEKLGTIKTKVILADKSLGGRAFDLCIAKQIEDEAVEKLGIPRVIGKRGASDLKAQFSIMRAANKIREVLSANSATPYTVEGIAQDKDFSSTFTREKFEKSCGDLFTRVKNLTSEVVKQSGVPLKNIDAFELMGGVSRTPKIISDIKSVLGKEPDRTMNMDEAAAVGSAYYGVKESPHYRTKSFGVNERVPYGVYFTVDTANQTSAKRILFNESELIGTPYSITLAIESNFNLSFYEDMDSKEPFAKATFTAVEPFLKHAKTKMNKTINTHIIRMKATVNGSGLLQISDASLIYRSDEEIVKGFDDYFRAVNETQKKSYPLRPKIIWLNPNAMSPEAFKNSSKKIHKIETNERIKFERAHAKNDLESYVFWAKREGVLENKITKARLTGEQLAQFTKSLEDTLHWLEDGDGSMDSCSQSMYEAKLNDLKKELQSYIPDEKEAKGNNNVMRDDDDDDDDEEFDL